MQRFWKYVLMSSLLLSVAVAWAAPVTQQIPFTTTTTLTVPKTYTFRFSLWDLETGGTAATNRIWWEIKVIDMATKTLTTDLGSVTTTPKRSGPLSDVDFSEQYWVQVEKLGANGKTWRVIGARTKFTVVPYAMWSAQGGDDISVNAGNGLTGTTSSDGDITLNVGAGAGISVGTDTVSVQAGGITNTMLADGAVTDAKITGPISLSKLDTIGLNSAYVNVSGDTMTGTLKLPSNGLTAGTDQLVLTGGNVGIGTTTPLAKLHVNGGAGSFGIVGESARTNAYGVRGQSDNGTFAAGVSAWSSEGYGIFAHSGNYAGYFEGPKTYVSGNLGVGTTTPAAKLHVETTAGGSIYAETTGPNVTTVTAVSGSGSVAYALVGISPQGTGVFGNGGNYGGYFLGPKTYVQGNLGIGQPNPGYKLDVVGPANLNRGIASGGALYVNSQEALWFNGTYFSWGYGGSWNYFADKVGIGITNPGVYKLYVAGNAYTTGTWGSSDVRWKKNIATLESSLDKVLQLRGVSYDWNTEEYPDNGFSKDRQIGFIAQEVESVIPEVVKTGSDGYKALAYDKIVAVLVEAIKEQQVLIEELKNQNKEQQAQIEGLRQR